MKRENIVLFAVLGLALYLERNRIQGVIMWSIPDKYKKAATPFIPLFNNAEQKYNLPTGLLSRIAWQESRFNGNAVSPVGAIGLMQFMPATAEGYKVDLHDGSSVDDIDGAARMFRDLSNEFKAYAPNHWPLVLASYNWGSGRVWQWLRGQRDSWPDETIEYVESVTRDLGLPVGPRVNAIIA
jgi:soluble lytic murein transglycosylase-like protein